MCLIIFFSVPLHLPWKCCQLLPHPGNAVTCQCLLPCYVNPPMHLDLLENTLRQRKQMAESPYPEDIVAQKSGAHFGPLPLFPGRWRTRGILKKETEFQTPTGSPQQSTRTWHGTAAERMQKEQRGQRKFPIICLSSPQMNLKESACLLEKN